MVEIFTLDGKRFKGILIDKFGFVTPQWFKIKTKNTIMAINTSHIVSIIFFEKEK